MCRGDGHTWALAQFPKMGSTPEDQVGPGEGIPSSVWGVLGRGYLWAPEGDIESMIGR